MKVATLYANVSSRCLKGMHAFFPNPVPVITSSSHFSSAAAKKGPFSLTVYIREREREREIYIEGTKDRKGKKK
jgi:hypothetical protein